MRHKTLWRQIWGGILAVSLIMSTPATAMAATTAGQPAVSVTETLAAETTPAAESIPPPAENPAGTETVNTETLAQTADSGTETPKAEESTAPPAENEPESVPPQTESGQESPPPQTEGGQESSSQETESPTLEQQDPGKTDDSSASEKPEGGTPTPTPEESVPDTPPENDESQPDRKEDQSTPATNTDAGSADDTSRKTETEKETSPAKPATVTGTPSVPTPAPQASPIQTPPSAPAVTQQYTKPDVYIAPAFRRTREDRMVTTENVFVFEETSEDSRKTGELKQGASVYRIKEAGDGWTFIETADKSGAILRGFVKNETISEDRSPDTETNLLNNGALVTVFQRRGTNKAFTYTYTTTYNALVQTKNIESDGEDIAEYALSFQGNPYKWGGDSLTEGCDSSAFTRLVFKHFGISLPKGTYEQCWEGKRIDVKDAEPGDLICYGSGDIVYHTLICTANDTEKGLRAVSAASAKLGIAETEVDLEKACWACRLIETEKTSTQVVDIRELGRAAYNGDREAQEKIVRIILKAAEAEWNQYGFSRPVLTAQVILESGWCSCVQADNGGIQPKDNNILGMNADLNNGTWESPWTGGMEPRYVPQVHGGVTSYNYEYMRTYEDIEACLSDYAAFKIGIHPELAGCTDIDRVIEEGLRGYATSPTYNERIRAMIDRYDILRIEAEYEKEKEMSVEKTEPVSTESNQTSDSVSMGSLFTPETH